MSVTVEHLCDFVLLADVSKQFSRRIRRRFRGSRGGTEQGGSQELLNARLLVSPSALRAS